MPLDRQHRARIALVSTAREFGEAIAADKYSVRLHMKANETLYSLVSGRPVREQRLIAYFCIREMYRRSECKETVALGDSLFSQHISTDNLNLHLRLMRWRQRAINRLSGKADIT